MKKLLTIISLLIFISTSAYSQKKTAGDHLIASRRSFHTTVILYSGSVLLAYVSARQNEVCFFKKAMRWASIGAGLTSIGFSYATFWHIGKAGKLMNKITLSPSGIGMVIRI